MIVCRLAPEGGINYADVDDAPHALHDLLGGDMETFPLPPILAKGGLIAVADGDGYRKALPYNVYSPLLGRQIVGPVVIIRAEPPEFVSLTHDDVAALDDWFGHLLVINCAS